MDEIGFVLKKREEVMKMNVVLAAEVGNVLQEGFGNMLVGLGVVFAVLVFLSIIIWAFKFLNKVGAKPAAAPAAAPAAPAPVKAAAPVPAAPAVPGKMAKSEVAFSDVDSQTAAVILGVMAQECGGNFKVTSIKKSK